MERDLVYTQLYVLGEGLSRWAVTEWRLTAPPEMPACEIAFLYLRDGRKRIALWCAGVVVDVYVDAQCKGKCVLVQGLHHVY